MNTYKVIIQLTSGDAMVHKSIIGQIKNLLKYFNMAVMVELVCHGASMPFCLQRNNSFVNEINELILGKVKIVACENMMCSNNVTAADLIEGIQIVPAGIAELVIKQKEGWSYIKAGF